MPIEVEYEGTVHEFPDDFTDAEIAAALGGGPPKVATPPPPSATIGMLAPSTVKGDPAVPGTKYGGIQNDNVRGMFQRADMANEGLKQEAREHPIRTAAMIAAPTVLSKAPGILHLAKEGGARALGISSARAGQNIQTAVQASRAVPINTASVSQVGAEVAKFKGKERIPQVVRGLITRAQDPTPLTVEEARTFYPALSRMSVNDFNSLTPNMQRLVGQMRAALNEAITEGAETVGMGAKYTSGMKEYARASKAAKYGKKAAKYAGGFLGVDYALRRLGDAMKSGDQ